MIRLDHDLFEVCEHVSFEQGWPAALRSAFARVALRASRNFVHSREITAEIRRTASILPVAVHIGHNLESWVIWYRTRASVAMNRTGDGCYHF